MSWITVEGSTTTPFDIMLLNHRGFLGGLNAGLEDETSE